MSSIEKKYIKSSVINGHLEKLVEMGSFLVKPETHNLDPLPKYMATPTIAVNKTLSKSFFSIDFQLPYLYGMKKRSMNKVIFKISSEVKATSRIVWQFYR